MIKGSIQEEDIKIANRDFLVGSVVKNLPSNVGDVGSNLRCRTKLLHASGQLSSHSEARESLQKEDPVKPCPPRKGKYICSQHSQIYICLNI